MSTLSRFFGLGKKATTPTASSLASAASAINAPATEPATATSTAGATDATTAANAGAAAPGFDPTPAPPQANDNAATSTSTAPATDMGPTTAPAAPIASTSTSTSTPSIPSPITIPAVTDAPPAQSSLMSILSPTTSVTSPTTDETTSLLHSQQQYTLPTSSSSEQPTDQTHTQTHPPATIHLDPTVTAPTADSSASSQQPVPTSAPIPAPTTTPARRWPFWSSLQRDSTKTTTTTATTTATPTATSAATSTSASTSASTSISTKNAPSYHTPPPDPGGPTPALRAMMNKQADAPATTNIDPATIVTPEEKASLASALKEEDAGDVNDDRDRTTVLDVHAPVIYFTDDPIENLQIRVVLRKQPADATDKVIPATLKGLNLYLKTLQRTGMGYKDDELREEARKKEEDEKKAENVDHKHDTGPDAKQIKDVICTQIFEWQEKVHGPREILSLMHPMADVSSPLGIQYQQQIKQMLTRQFPGVAPDEASRILICRDGGIRLFSMIEDDGFIDPRSYQKVVSTSVGAIELTPVARRMIELPQEKRGKSHHARDAKFQSYSILACVDLPSDPTNMKSLKKIAKLGYQQVLCQCV